jgi:hypothetical protein
MSITSVSVSRGTLTANRTEFVSSGCVAILVLQGLPGTYAARNPVEHHTVAGL